VDVLHTKCAGLDVDKRTVVVCIRHVEADGVVRKPTRAFGTMTADLLGLADGRDAEGVRPAAMESTGVSWKPIRQRPSMSRSDPDRKPPEPSSRRRGDSQGNCSCHLGGTHPDEKWAGPGYAGGCIRPRTRVVRLWCFEPEEQFDLDIVTNPSSSPPVSGSTRANCSAHRGPPGSGVSYGIQKIDSHSRSMISDLKSFRDNPLQSEIRDLKSGNFFPGSISERLSASARERMGPRRGESWGKGCCRRSTSLFFRASQSVTAERSQSTMSGVATLDGWRGL
jgi:hypothetical protein